MGAVWHARASGNTGGTACHVMGNIGDIGVRVYAVNVGQQEMSGIWELPWLWELLGMQELQGIQEVLPVTLWPMSEKINS